MSEQPGRGYLPPTVPAPGAHRRPWPPSIVQQPSYFGGQHWQPQTKPFIVLGSGSPQSEGIDLSSRPEPTHNGGEPVNGQLKEGGGVSVIAPNPLVQPEEVKEEENAGSKEKSIGSKASFERPIPLDYLPIDNKMPPYPLEYKGHPAHPLPSKGLEVGIPSPLESKGIPAESKGTPSHPVESKVPFQGKPSEPVPTAPSQPPAEVEVKEAGQAPEADHVESLLQNMFQGEDCPVKQSVIVSTSTRAPVLTEDKVVAILEDKNEPTTPATAPQTPPPPPSPQLPSPQLPPPLPSSPPVEELIPVKTEPAEPDKKSQFMEVEFELEKMFAGIVEPPDELKSQPRPELKKKTKRARPRPRKSTDSTADKKDKKRKNKKVEDMRDGKSKKAKRIKITKEGSNDSMAVMIKGRGPYIHIEGSREAPRYVGVVNSWGREEEERERGLDKGTGRRKQHSLVEGRVKGSGLYISTLSAKYNSQSADTTWICIFCKLRSHCENGLGGEPAGDLFGPYIISIPKSEDLCDGRTPAEKEVAAEQKKKGGGKQLSLRAAGAAEQFIKDFTKKSKKNSSTIEDLSGEREVWVHEMCAVWAPGVLLVGPHLIGLGDAIASASITKCSACGEVGACIGCVVRNCSGRSHYGCAVAARWDLDFDNFIATCPIHAQKRLKLLGVRSA